LNLNIKFGSATKKSIQPQNHHFSPSTHHSHFDHLPNEYTDTENLKEKQRAKNTLQIFDFQLFRLSLHIPQPQVSFMNGLPSVHLCQTTVIHAANDLVEFFSQTRPFWQINDQVDGLVSSWIESEECLRSAELIPVRHVVFRCKHHGILHFRKVLDDKLVKLGGAEDLDAISEWILNNGVIKRTENVECEVLLMHLRNGHEITLVVLHFHEVKQRSLVSSPNDHEVDYENHQDKSGEIPTRQLNQRHANADGY
jgi:hypothetical protein